MGCLVAWLPLLSRVGFPFLNIPRWNNVDLPLPHPTERLGHQNAFLTEAILLNSSDGWASMTFKNWSGEILFKAPPPMFLGRLTPVLLGPSDDPSFCLRRAEHSLNAKCCRP